jgi:hypothetical protein
LDNKFYTFIFKHKVFITYGKLGKKMSESSPHYSLVRLNMTFQLIYHEFKNLEKESLTLPRSTFGLFQAEGLTREKSRTAHGHRRNITGVMDRLEKVIRLSGPGHGGPENYSSETYPKRILLHKDILYLPKNGKKL